MSLKKDRYDKDRERFEKILRKCNIQSKDTLAEAKRRAGKRRKK